jgi:hypothetical protein
MKILLLTFILFTSVSLFGQKKKKLTGWHTYSQIIAKGYKTEPFEGKVFIRKTRKKSKQNVFEK